MLDFVGPSITPNCYNVFLGKRKIVVKISEWTRELSWIVMKIVDQESIMELEGNFGMGLKLD